MLKNFERRTALNRASIAQTRNTDCGRQLNLYSKERLKMGGLQSGCLLLTGIGICLIGVGQVMIRTDNETIPVQAKRAMAGKLLTQP
jgi:hypothetical protein